MSIQGQITRVSDEVATQADLLAQIKTALEGKGTESNPIEVVEQATPQISVNADGLITATATQKAGYVEAGTKSATKQLTAQAAQTITPGTADKTIAAGRYLTGAQTIKGDANLVAENIVSGKSIFGVAGTAQSIGFIKEVSVTPKNSQAIDGSSVWNSGIKIRVDGLKAGTTYKIYGGYGGGNHNSSGSTIGYPITFNGTKILQSDYTSRDGWTVDELTWSIENDYLVIPPFCISENKTLNLVIFKL